MNAAFSYTGNMRYEPSRLLFDIVGSLIDGRAHRPKVPPKKRPKS